MKGDYSRFDFERKQLRKRIDYLQISNFRGVLHQQGKVLLDSDWNAQTIIANDWEDQVGQDIIGAGVAAIPASEFENFKIKTIDNISPEEIRFQITPGRIWADGMPLYLDKFTLNSLDTIIPLERIATPLLSQALSSSTTTSTTTTTTTTTTAPATNEERYVILLEVWRDIINGFQVRDLLLEPALGGIDTTQRMQTAFAFKFHELAPGAAFTSGSCAEKAFSCANIGKFIENEVLPADKGQLTVTFESRGDPEDECPRQAWSGYMGLEHRHYRIEIAEISSTLITDSEARFKWSRFNGGLVGRGELNKADSRVKIKENLKAIRLSRQQTESSFYLEIIHFIDDYGFWKPIYGAEVLLTDDDYLDITKTYLDLTDITNTLTGDIFFRLWDGISTISAYQYDPSKPLAEPNSLEDGICLQFDIDGKVLRPGDYWTFPVRAMRKAAASADSFLLKNAEPAGPDYHYVPLAIVSQSATGQIEVDDCRVIFRPLTNLKKCVSFTVGDGCISHGDFDDVRAALENLPQGGGEINLLPGEHEINLTIDRDNIRIIGCGKSTQVRSGQSSSTIFSIDGATNVLLKNMHITMEANYPPIDIFGAGPENIEICNNKITSTQAMPIRISHGTAITVHHNVIDGSGAHPISIAATTEVFIEKNEIIGGLEIGGEIGGSEGIIIRDNDISSTTHPISISQVTGIIIHHNVIDGSGTHPIAIEGTAKAFIEKNEIIGGLEIEGASNRIIIRDNDISSTIHPIRILHATAITVHHNVIDESSSLPIIITATDDVIVEKNEMSTGIEIAGGSARIAIRENHIEGAISSEDGNEVELHSNKISSSETPIDIRGGAKVKIVRNKIDIINPTDQNYFIKGIYIKASDSTVEKNEITSHQGAQGQTACHGGLQIAGGSARIAIRKNRIFGGSGNGITLGNEFVEGALLEAIKNGQYDQIIPLAAEKRDRGELSFLHDIKIERNEISGMARSGIGMAGFFQFGSGIGLGIIDNVKNRILENETINSFYQLGNKMENLSISQNHIDNCLGDFNPESMGNPELLTDILKDELGDRGNGLGGISLLSCRNLSIQNNRIVDNGKWPVCGIYLNLGENIEISHNTLVNNSENVTIGDVRVLDYFSGGIIIRFAIPDLGSSSSVDSHDNGVLTIFDKPAAYIHDNIVHPNYGQALLLAVALGPVSIINNSFKSPISSLPADFVLPEDFEVNALSLAGKFRLEAGAVYVLNIGGLANFLNSLSLVEKKYAWQLALEKVECLKTTDGKDSCQLFAWADGNKIWQSERVEMVGGGTFWELDVTFQFDKQFTLKLGGPITDPNFPPFHPINLLGTIKIVDPTEDSFEEEIFKDNACYRIYYKIERIEIKDSDSDPSTIFQANPFSALYERADVASLFDPTMIQFFLNGNTIFNDNQAFLGEDLSTWSQKILSIDDIEFIGNQSESINPRKYLERDPYFGNTFLYAMTSLRACNNRFKELVTLAGASAIGFIASNPASTFSTSNPHSLVTPISNFDPNQILSLLTYSGIFNFTKFNQGDHCILRVAGPYKPLGEDNQMLNCPTQAVAIAGDTAAVSKDTTTTTTTTTRTTTPPMISFTVTPFPFTTPPGGVVAWTRGVTPPFSTLPGGVIGVNGRRTIPVPDIGREFDLDGMALELGAGISDAQINYVAEQLGAGIKTRMESGEKTIPEAEREQIARNLVDSTATIGDLQTSIATVLRAKIAEEEKLKASIQTDENLAAALGVRVAAALGARISTALNEKAAALEPERSGITAQETEVLKKMTEDLTKSVPGALEARTAEYLTKAIIAEAGK